jgi:UDP-glucose 4-epimerase
MEQLFIFLTGGTGYIGKPECEQIIQESGLNATILMP